MIVINNESFFSSYEIDNLRTSQKKILELAEKALLDGNYDEAKSLYNTVRHTVHNPEVLNKIDNNINNIEKIQNKALESQQKNEGKRGETSSQTGGIIGGEGFTVRIDNITISGINIDATGEAVKLINRALKLGKVDGKKESGEEKGVGKEVKEDKIGVLSSLDEGETDLSGTIESSGGEPAGRQKTGPDTNGNILQEDRVVSSRGEDKIAGSVLSGPNEKGSGTGVVEIGEIETDKMKVVEREIIKEVIRESGDKEVKEGKSLVGSEPFSEVRREQVLSGEEAKLVEGEIECERKSGKVKERRGEKESDKEVEEMDIELEKVGDENVEIEKEPIETEEEKNKLEIIAKLGDEPIKIEPTLKPPPEKIMKPIELTYNFFNVFHNKFYFKYENLFEDAARLVKENKLDEAIEYYKVILDQKIPETLKMMIRANIEELQKAILNTFKKTDTMVTLDYSGKLVSVEDKIKLEGKESGSKRDVYFEEGSDL